MYKLVLTGLLLITLAGCQSTPQDNTNAVKANKNAAVSTSTTETTAPTPAAASQAKKPAATINATEQAEPKNEKPARINPNKPSDQTLEGRAQGISRLHCLCKDMKIATRKAKCEENVKNRLEKAYESYPNDVKAKLTARYNQLIQACK